MKLIYIFGHSDDIFPNIAAFENYLRNDLINHGRYLYQQSRNTDTIVLSFKGLILGELSVVGREEPTPDDEGYRAVYIIREIQIYEKPVRAADHDLKQYQLGMLLGIDLK